VTICQSRCSILWVTLRYVIFCFIFLCLELSSFVFFLFL